MKEKILVTALFVLSVFLIIFHFYDTPKVWVDEGIFTNTAETLAEHGVLGIQISPGNFMSMRNFLLSTSYPVIFPVALSLKIFGIGLWQSRLPMLLYMLLLVIAFYLFTKKRYGFQTAAISILLLISFSPFYGNGRPVQGEVPALAWLVLGSWLLLKLEAQNFTNKRTAVFAGLVLGLSATVKPLFLVCVPFSLFVAIVLNWKKINNKKIIYFLFLGLFPPVLLWVFIHIPTFHDLVNFIPNILYFSSNHDSVEKVSLFKTVFKNGLRFVTESTPILFTILFGSTVFSLVSRWYKKKNIGINLPETMIFVFIFCNISGYLLGTGWYRYFFPANVLIFLLFPAAVISFTDFFVSSKKFKKIILSGLYILVAFQFVHLIFLSDTSFVVNRTRNMELTRAFSLIDQNKSVLFYDTIESKVLFKGQNYTQYFALGDFLIGGDKDVIKNTTSDYIVTQSAAPVEVSSCYIKVPVNSYVIYRRFSDVCHDGLKIKN